MLKTHQATQRLWHLGPDSSSSSCRLASETPTLATCRKNCKRMEEKLWNNRKYTRSETQSNARKVAADSWVRVKGSHGPLTNCYKAALLQYKCILHLYIKIYLYIYIR